MSFWTRFGFRVGLTSEKIHLLHELLFDGRLHLAPITSNPQNALDVGTGRGDWAIDFAEYVLLFHVKIYSEGDHLIIVVLTGSIHLLG